MTDSQHAVEPFILFDLAGATYGVRSRDVLHMDMVEHVTPVPNAPQFLEGVVFSRGEVIPAINLRSRFGFERVPHGLRSRLMVARSGARTVGFIVDTAREFISIDPEMIQPPPEEISGLSGRYLEGIAKIGERLILILNMEEVLKMPDGTEDMEEGESGDGSEERVESDGEGDSR
jgi:purine-binding chemotaxis protein CheW